MPDGRVVPANTARTSPCPRRATNTQAVSCTSSSCWLALLGLGLAGPAVTQACLARFLLTFDHPLVEQAPVEHACCVARGLSPPTPPKAAKYVGIVRLPAAVDIVVELMVLRHEVRVLGRQLYARVATDTVLTSGAVAATASPLQGDAIRASVRRRGLRRSLRPGSAAKSPLVVTRVTTSR